MNYRDILNLFVFLVTICSADYKTKDFRFVRAYTPTEKHGVSNYQFYWSAYFYFNQFHLAIAAY